METKAKSHTSCMCFRYNQNASTLHSVSSRQTHTLWFPVNFWSI